MNCSLSFIIKLITGVKNVLHQRAIISLRVGEYDFLFVGGKLDENGQVRNFINGVFPFYTITCFIEDRNE